ncbi:Protein of unknown function [Ferrimonas sediminum]|uniref:DUF3108 domain-containing protein n=1 Tax=Ferrimonas sediminum TaxID=718193 RepID=A0A1G8WDN2_9GAMM|nr:DUF3108 domain-containing protein [Ferrimonas sediminum]SDJ76331.1 Protein of unknown function [Ferrimonas sediminum]
MRIWPLMALLLTASGVANPLLPYRADYQVWRGNSQLGSGYYQLQQQQDGLYSLDYQSKVGWLFLSDTRTEISEFRVNGTTLMPSKYRMKRSGTGPDFHASISFDWQLQRIDAQYRDERKQLPWSQPRFDPLSYQLQLRLDVARGDTDMLYPIVYKNKERDYRYKVVGKETLRLPFGTLDTIKVARDRGEGSSRQTYLWLALDHHHVLAKLIQYKDGDVQAELRLERLTFSEAATPPPAVRP